MMVLGSLPKKDIPVS